MRVGMAGLADAEADGTPGMSDVDALEWFLRAEPERVEFVTPWGRVREMSVREVREVRRRMHEDGSALITWAQSWWLRRESYLSRPWCREPDEQRIASAYATVATAWAKQASDKADERRRR